PVEGRSLYLRGRIDRIDVTAGKALIRDLKTGRPYHRIAKEADPDPVRDTQIALYGLVAAQLAHEWQIPTRVAAAYSYFGRGAAEREFRDDFHEALEPAALKWLRVAVGLLAERQFPRTPDPEDCRYCAYRVVCGAAAQERARMVLAGAGGTLGE